MIINTKNKNIIDQLKTFNGQFSSKKLNDILSTAIRRLEYSETSHLPEPPIELFVWTSKAPIANTKPVIDLSESIKSFRAIHNTGLYETKVHLEIFIELNREKIQSAIEEYWR